MVLGDKDNLGRGEWLPPSQAPGQKPPKPRGGPLADHRIVTLTLIAGQGWVSGSIALSDPGKGLGKQRRPITCRAEDAPQEVAELVEWALGDRQDAPSLFDV